nr:vacuolar protein sorting-associated protein 13-like isoform X1 [Onthophagus taurus]
MVFESLLNQVLNSVLGDYIENLDTKQLNLGVWGGDVVLKNLILKQSALKDLDLPIQTVYGQLGKLTIKVPWHKIYTLPTEVTVEGLYIVVEPNSQVEYNEEKESTKLQREKQNHLKKMDLAKQRALEANKDKVEKAGFVERLVTQIIKNLQVRIKNIHVRYEDKITNPTSPFATGLTLSQIYVQSTDEKFMATVSPNEKLSRIFKMLEVQALSVYWNCNSELYRDLKPEALIKQLQNDIATKDNIPEQYTYILGPIHSAARLKLNPRPDLDANRFVIPKVMATWEMEQLAVGMSKQQYRDIIGLADSMALMSRGEPFRKFRPHVPYKGHYKEWWHFAYNCILESEVRRKHNNFNWDHIKKHLHMCKQYGKMYKLKMQSKKLAPEDENKIEKLEKALDLMNIVLVRQKINLELEKLERDKPQAAGGWFGWFGNQEEKPDASKNIAAQFQEVMTPEEKQRFYKAINYNENAAAAVQPTHYIDVVLSFLLRKLVVRVYNDKHNVLLTQFFTAKLKLEMRTSGNGVAVHANINEISVTGIKQSGYKPKLMSCNPTEDGSLCDVIFEVNPLHSKCTNRLYATVKPIKIIYDAMTINGIVDLFTIPRSSTLQQLSDVATSTFDNVKYQSTAKLQYVIDQHSQIELAIDLYAPYVIIPYGGIYTETENIIAINLGHAKFFSVQTDKSTIKEKQQKLTQKELISAVIEESYDKFLLEFSDLQVMVVPGGENWLHILKECTKTNYHILYPLSLSLEFHICLIDFDPRLPKCKIRGVLPSLSLNITDFQIVLTLGLINSIPLPKTEETSPASKQDLRLRRPSSQTLEFFDFNDKEVQTTSEEVTKEVLRDVVGRQQYTNLEVLFTISELCVNIKHQEYSHSPVEDVARISLESLSASVLVQTFAQTVSLKLQNLIFDKYHHNEQVPLIATPAMSFDDNLLKVTFLKVDKKSPDFATTYKSTEALLSVDIEVIQLRLHQEILHSLVQYVNDLQIQLEELQKPTKPMRLNSSLSSMRQVKRSISEVISQTSQVQIAQKKSKAVLYGSDSPNILFKVEALLQEFQVSLTSDFGDLTSLTVNHVMAQVVLKEPYTQVSVVMKNIEVKDLSSQTKYIQILKVLSDEVVNFNLFLYNKEIDTSRREDMAVSVSVGHIRIVFLNLYVSKVLSFINKFTQAREAIIEASKAAADKAKQNVTNIYENAVQMSIRVTLKAPQVLIPENSNSLDGLICDLGNLTIQNTFLEINVKNENTGSNAIVDEMELKLSDIQLSRVECNKQLVVINSIMILEPVNLGLTLKRNLSSSWYKAIPDIQVSGYIDTIEVVLGQADYSTIMSIVLGNLGEVVQEPVVETKTPLQPISEIKSTNYVLSVEAESGQTQSEKPATEEEPTLFLKFSLIMKKFSLRLLATDDTLMETRSFKAVRTNLAMLSLEDLCIKGRMLTDGAIHTSVVLIDCVIEDTRIGKEDMLNKMFSRAYNTDVDSESSGYKSMIDVVFHQRKEQTYLDLKISGFNLILSMEFISKLQSFVMSAFSDQNAGGAPPATKASSTQKASSNKSTYPVTKSTVQIEKPSNQVEKSSSQIERSSQSELKHVQNTTINIKLDKPDIVLVEHLNNINTNALIFNFQLLFKLRLSENRQIISGLAKDIQMYTCCYNPAEREETKHLVLFPFTVNIAGSTPEGKGLHIEVCLTEICLKISPATIELLNRAYTSMFLIEQNVQMEVDTFINLLSLWDPVPYNETHYWFFNTDVAEDAIEYIGSAQNQVSVGERKHFEICIVRLPRIVITVEIGEGKGTLPVLTLESSFEGHIQDWSADMLIDSTMTLQMAYYNSFFAIWEPLIEPTAYSQDNNVVYNPWELKLDVCVNNGGGEVTSPQSDSDPEEPLIVGQPKMSIIFSSKSNLDVTISKTTLEVLMNMSQAFSNAVNLTILKPPQRDTPPYKIINRSGLAVKIDCEKSNFHVYQQVAAKDVILENGAEVALQLKEIDRTDYSLNEIFGNLNLNVHNKFLYITVIQMECEIELNLTRADARYFSLNYRDNKDSWGIVKSTLFEESTYKVILSSIVKIYNHLHLPLDVYYMTPKGNEVECIGSIEPEETFHVPVNAVYTPTSELFFSVQKYSVSSQPFVWKDLHLMINQTQMLQCSPMKILGHSEPFVIKAISSIEQIYNENTTKRTMNSILCNVHIHPAVLFRNCLPYNIYLTVQNVDEEFLIEPGDTLPVTNGIPGATYLVLRIPNYLDKEWTCIRDILASPPQFSVWTFDSFDSTQKVSLDLGVHTLEDGGPLLMTLYCPFWMLNKSELNIGYRKSKKVEKNESSGSPHKNSDENFNVLHHPANFKGPILFSFNAKNFFGKKKAAIRIENGGEWSDKFSIDVAGSSGVITCKFDDKIYQFGVNIELTYNGLTKQVTFTPYYVLINNSPFPLECQENDRPADPWTVVQANSCAGLWPVGDFDDKLLRMRVVGTKEVSPPFYFSDSHNTVLKLANKYGGIHVDTQITEGAVYITFAKYQAGMAQALIINNTRNTLNIWEKDTVQLLKLDPGYKMFYSWSSPSKARVLCWEAGYKKEIEDDLRKDGCGDYDIAENNHVYWTSFLDGMQRTLLFTCNPDVARNAQSSQIFEKIDQEVTFSIFGIGLSLVNNDLRREIMYVAIANSGIIWETCKHGSNRYKQMGPKESAMMETSYGQYMALKEVEENLHGRMVVDGKTEVNFRTLRMLRPHLRKIRRTFLNGLWLQMTTNPYMLQLHAKINRIQIDNQSYDCMFPVVLAPVSLAKSVAGTQVHKPFAELSIVQMLIKHSQIKQFKYFKLLIQEFHINLELGFVTAISEVFQTSKDTLEKQKISFLLDTELVNKPLYQHVSQQSLQEQKSFYDLLHFSPLKIHVSFSLGSSGLDMAPNVVTVLLQSLGVTLTDMQDVVFRIAYFEREYTFLTQKQLVGEAISHYIGQAVKQLYALVLGLDVLGNPYGLVLGITKGVEDLFYEPFQGAIQGPGEFAEGLALGVRSLFGHTVGGAAGAVSRITGAMGKGVAALTFDKEFQRKRRDALNRKATSVSEGIARSGKGLVMGVYDGVTGVIKKPISGAKEQGIGGFFKGLGKGAVGLVARPTSGVIDFASSSLDTVKRVTDLSSQEVHRLRPSRYIYSDGFIRPYNEREAQGSKILSELEKGKFGLTDLYLYHIYIVGNKEILMLTDQRLLYIVHSDIFGIWQAEWSYTWDEISMPPKVVPKGVLVMAADPKKKKTFFAHADHGKTILIADPNVSERICSKIIEVHSSHNS